MASKEDHLTITFDLLDIESLMAALLVATWNHQSPKDRENALRLYNQVCAAAGPNFFGSSDRARELYGPRGTNPEDGR